MSTDMPEHAPAEEARSADVADRRTAVDMSAKLSTQLIATSVGMLAVEGAFVTYALTSRAIGPAFFILAGLAAAAFVLSIMCAGAGISKARKAGFEGRWSLLEGKDEFNKQALGNLVALGALFLAFVAFLNADRRPDKSGDGIAEVSAGVARLTAELERTRKELEAMRSEMRDRAPKGGAQKR